MKRLLVVVGVLAAPGALGYLDEKRDSAFLRVDPVTGNRAPVFSQTVLAKLKAEFPGPGLPARVGPLDLATTEPGKYSPTYRHDAFIRDYDNLYLLDTQTGSEEPIVQGTSEDNLIGFLGAGSWFVWSPDGKRIGYLKADQRGFHRYPVRRDQDRKATVEFFRYPFTVDSDPPLELKGFDVASGSSRTWLADSSSTYLDPPNNCRVVADGRFLWSSEASGWRHLYLYDRNGRQLRQLTAGEWVVGEVMGLDEKRGIVDFTGVTCLGLEHLRPEGWEASRAALWR